MMHMGSMTKDFVPVGKDEQAEIKDETNSQKVAELLGESLDGRHRTEMIQNCRHCESLCHTLYIIVF